VIRLNEILDRVAEYDPHADLELIQKAYVFSAKAHRGQVRLSGEPYLNLDRLRSSKPRTSER
jgi:guanosine-3',5'-bis(diphosphate) 3'-pyrophosphohydrolase